MFVDHSAGESLSTHLVGVLSTALGLWSEGPKAVLSVSNRCVSATVQLADVVLMANQGLVILGPFQSTNTGKDCAGDGAHC